jgi:hypothetical protein
MTEPCDVIVSDLEGNLIATGVSDTSGRFIVPVSLDPHQTERAIVTFYHEGSYGLDSEIAGAAFMAPTISGTQ